MFVKFNFFLDFKMLRKYFYVLKWGIYLKIKAYYFI